MAVQVTVADEWTECRATIGRFDTILSDTRKYGFTLVTILLTANSLLGQTIPLARPSRGQLSVAGPGIVMALLLVLYLLDRYWYVLLRAAVALAVDLEDELRQHGNGPSITHELGRYAHAARSSYLAVGVYAMFFIITGAIGVFLGGNSIVIGTITALALAAMLAVQWWVHAQLKGRDKRATYFPPSGSTAGESVTSGTPSTATTTSQGPS